MTEPYFKSYDDFSPEEIEHGAIMDKFYTRVAACHMMDNKDLIVHIKSAQHLFFYGGKLSSLGYSVKENIDFTKAFWCIISLLKSKEANHVQKEVTAAIALMTWFNK